MDESHKYIINGKTSDTEDYLLPYSFVIKFAQTKLTYTVRIQNSGYFGKEDHDCKGAQ